MDHFYFPTKSSIQLEQDRLKKLNDYEVLGTTAETAYDRIATLASEIFEPAKAVISFSNTDEIFVKANIGCSTADINIVKEWVSIALTQIDEVFIKDLNSEVKSAASNFFVAVPLITAEGLRMGHLSVLSAQTKAPSALQLKMLSSLASAVIEKLDLNFVMKKIFKVNDELTHMLVHDLKNSITSISLQSELIGRLAASETKVSLIAGKINQQSQNIVKHLNQILNGVNNASDSVKILKNKFNLKEVFIKVFQNFELILFKNNQTLHAEIDPSLEIYGDSLKLQLAFQNLLNNAIRHSVNGGHIYIMVSTSENKASISIKDTGSGLNSEDIDRVFIKFAVLNGDAENAIQSNGLDLSTVKMIVDLHKGKIWAESEGENKGTSYLIELPIK